MPNHSARVGEITPDGIGRHAVRPISGSMSRSTKWLMAPAPPDISAPPSSVAKNMPRSRQTPRGDDHRRGGRRQQQRHDAAAWSSCTYAANTAQRARRRSARTDGSGAGARQRGTAGDHEHERDCRAERSSAAPPVCSASVSGGLPLEIGQPRRCTLSPSVLPTAPAGQRHEPSRWVRNASTASHSTRPAVTYASRRW